MIESSQSKQGTLIQADFFNNSGGLNITDSPFQVENGQAVDGYNYEYLATGGITKRNGHSVINASPDAQLKSLGFWNYFTPLNIKTMLRAAGTRLQTFNPISGATTTVTDDTALAGSTPFSDDTRQVVFSQFTSPTNSIAWFAGGGQGSGVINGYNGTHYTKNGVAAPAGSITLTTSASPILTTTGDETINSNVVTGLASVTGITIGLAVTGTNIPTNTVVLGISGTSVTLSQAATASATTSAINFYGALPDNTLYYYAIALHKASTGAQSNAALDNFVLTGVSGLGTSGGNTVTVSWSISGLDTAADDQIYIYRSSVTGTSGFTSGDLIAMVPSTTTSYLDTGLIQQTANDVPRAGNSLLDNSVLPAGTYNSIKTWKNRLITATGSTLYISDLNKSESWPTVNYIQIPSGGPITALAIISYISPVTAVTDELLVIFKEREMWTLAGTSNLDFALKFVDYVGCLVQPLAVFANGFLFFIDYRGVFLYDGTNKPVYISRLIEFDFSINGDLDLSKLAMGNGTFFRKQNEIIWFLSSASLGEQKLAYKLDLRLSLPKIQENFNGRMANAIFIRDSSSYPIYTCESVLPNASGTFLNEIMYAGDESGNILSMYSNGNGDGTFPVSFTHRTKIQDFGTIGTAKRYHKVIVWCRQSTTANLTLKYFVTYQTDDAHAATQSQSVGNQVTTPIWDQATWDSPYFDLNVFTYAPLVFNLGNPTIGIEGDALTLEFQQEDFGAPMIIVGYSVIYSVTGLRK